MKPELVVMAAGMGSRYGGLKQLESVGPSGETVMDYSIFDARRAGVERVIFVIRRELETAFRETIGTRYERWMEVAYAFQELDSLPKGFAVPEGRVKPWGTGHAVLAAKSQVKAPFLVINADDFYGSHAYHCLVPWLASNAKGHAMVAFRLRNTLSEHGSVARGICRVSADGNLLGVTEHTGLEQEGEGARERSADGSVIQFTGIEPVSMNFWGFQPGFMAELEARFTDFLKARGSELKAEFFLPSVVDTLVASGQDTVQVLDTPDRWFGVTYREDKSFVEERIRALVAQGVYARKSVELTMAQAARDLAPVCRQFQIPGQFLSAEPYGSGHINETYAAIYDQGGTQVRYIFQRLNTSIFQDPTGLMANVAQVTGHLRAKLVASNATDTSRRALSLIPALEGKSYVDDPEHGFWRVYLFVEGAKTYDVLEHEGQAYKAAKAFGEFQSLLADYEGPRLTETIPAFHNTPRRFDTFRKAIAEDVKGRAKDVQREIEFALSREALAGRLLALKDSGGVPERITHNDTKLNNVMLDDVTGEGICVIDLDTVMPGLSLYDFGDMVRTACNPVPEDHLEPEQVIARKDMFKALATGYLEGKAGTLLPVEREHLVVAGQLLTYECGIRFLTDYLQGDTYFRIHRPAHNLDRCRTQFALVKSLEQQESEFMLEVRELV